MRWILLSIAACALSAHAGTTSEPETKVIDRVAIIVDSEPIFASDLDRGDEAALIDEALVRIEARRLMVEVTADEVAAAIEEIKRVNGIGDQQLEDALREQGYTLASYRADVERQLLVLKTRSVLFPMPLDKSEPAMAAWLDERRRTAYIERPQ